MINLIYKIILIFILSHKILFQSVFAQDERVFRDIFSGISAKNPGIKYAKEYKFNASTPFYSLDLNSDKLAENLVFEKKDGEDWFHIHSAVRSRLFSFKFDPVGAESKLHKIEVRKLSKETKLILIYYFEGYTGFINYKGSGRLYLLTIDNNNFSTANVYRGPRFFEEEEYLKRHYNIRNFKVRLYDYDGDGVKEVILKHHTISKLCQYKGNGRWVTY